MSYAVHSFRIFLYGGIALFILYLSLRSTLSLPAIERFEGLRSHHEVHAGSQQPGAIEKSAHADHSFNYLENIPNFRNLPTYSDLDASFSGLFKRDVCSDTFPGTVKNTCTPGNTLCCVSLTNSFPQCQVIINSGYCCVSSAPTGGCYIDLTTSACGTTGAVKCTELTAGTTSEICCPAGTTCPNNFNQSLADVRCEIPYPSASSISSSSTSTSSSSTTSSTTSSFTSSTTSGQATASASSAVTSATSTTSSTLPAGAIAGIAVGAVAIILTLAALIFLLLKNQRNKARATAAAGPHTGIPYATTPGAPYGHDPYKQGEQYPRQAGEMDAVEQVRRMGELDAMASGPHLSRYELDGSVPPR